VSFGGLVPGAFARFCLASGFQFRTLRLQFLFGRHVAGAVPRLGADLAADRGLVEPVVCALVILVLADEGNVALALGGFGLLPCRIWGEGRGERGRG
jgi:hypothetical protein